jgi:2-(1,2-epoxy-1,2-dihydrophenyl)acetyl-CoA isomerase
MSQYETITVQREGRVAIVKFNRPDKLNSFNSVMRREFNLAAREVNGDSDIWVVVLAAEGRAFSAGADLTEPGSEFGDGHAVEDMLLLEYKPGILQIAQSRKPWIAAINGACAGIGYSYAMACDMAVMGESAFLYQPFAAIGLVPDGGSTWLVPHLVGSKRAFELMALGEKLKADKALEWGLVNRVVADDELAQESMALANTLAGKSPLALRHTKAALSFANRHSLADTIDYEASVQRVCIDSQDAKDAIDAFLNKRTPEWRNR